MSRGWKDVVTSHFLKPWPLPIRFRCFTHLTSLLSREGVIQSADFTSTKVPEGFGGLRNRCSCASRQQGPQGGYSRRENSTCLSETRGEVSRRRGVGWKEGQQILASLPFLGYMMADG